MACFSLETLRAFCPRPLSSFWWPLAMLGFPWIVDAFITSAYALLSHGILSVYPDFPLKRALVLALEAQPVSPHLNLTNHTCKDPVSK